MNSNKQRIKRTTKLGFSLLPPEKLPWYKFLTAFSLGWGLTKIGARHNPSYDEGHRDGFAKGKAILEIRDTRDTTAKRPKVDNFLFDHRKLVIPDVVEMRMRQDVSEKLESHKQPTKDQWKMILSDAPATNVVAGAGSGKSTTLVLRILLLHHYLGFELDCLTVVTFTKMSQIDFSEKLVEIFNLWGVPHRENQIKKTVRTFHSKILDFVREYPNLGDVKPFEFCKEKVPTVAEEALIDTNPFEGIISGGLQRQLLNQAYTDVYAKSHEFRKHIEILYWNSLALDKRPKDDPEVESAVYHFEKIARRDREVANATVNAWRQARAWPIDGISDQIETIMVNQKQFTIHGRVEASGCAVVLTADRYPERDFTRPGASAPLWVEAADKWAVLQVYCQEKMIRLRDANEGKQYVGWLSRKATIAPGFDHKLAGEISAQELLDCFANAASFIENLGLSVPVAVGKMQLQELNIDRAFFSALSEFWPTFQNHLWNHSPRIMTFNSMFALFGEKNPENLKRISNGLLRSMSHLMVDEFQDISPQIVSWVKAIFREVRRRGPDLHENRIAKHSSFLCVGDDWQSIYGWRGSSPSYFINFKDEFRASSYCSVMMRENYRSHQNIIDAAELMVAGVTSIDGKAAIAAGSSAANKLPVVIFDRDDAALKMDAIDKYQAGQSVMIIARSRKNRDAIEKMLSNLRRADNRLPVEKRRLSILTYHGSKGLQADAVFLVGDCIHLSDSPSKNEIYRIAGMGDEDDSTPYDTAQKEEILRLAYVAITRAALICYWYIDVDRKSGSNKPRASDRIDKRKTFFDDRRRTGSNQKIANGN